MNTAVATQDDLAAKLLEQVVVGGDLSKLSAPDRMQYYAKVCASVGLNPLTKPFEYITLNSKLTLYAKRDCTDQLRSIRGVSCQIVGRDLIGEIYVVTTRARDRGAREDEATGAVCITGLKGEALANAYMKAETKSKRRVTLSICGLGMLDESEVADIDPDTAAPASQAPVVQMPRPIAEKPAAPEAAAQGAEKKISESQLRLLTRTLQKHDIDPALFCKEFGIEKIEDLPFSKINDALKFASQTPE